MGLFGQAPAVYVVGLSMVTVSDIAAHLGVSRLTVSAVLNNRTAEVGIGEKTSRRVREAAEKLGYYPNRLALAMKTGINPVIGCFVSGLKNEWVGRTLSGFLDALRASGYIAKIEEVSGLEQETAALSLFMEQRVAGIFCCNFTPHQKFTLILNKATKAHRTPVVFSQTIQQLAGEHIDSDDAQGSGLAVDHFFQLGHRRIAFLGGASLEDPRCAGFCRALKKYDLWDTGNFTISTGWDRARNEALASEWLKDKKRRPTAILCGSDQIAAVTLRAARRMGLQVPAQLSVAGFSNSRICDLTDPPLTSVEQSFEEVGRRAGVHLVERIAARKKTDFSGSALNQELVKTTLVTRASCAAVPA